MPNFFIIGAGKSGTTSLYHYLKQHPDVFMSTVKEPLFFAFAGQHVTWAGPGAEKLVSRAITSLEDYQALFHEGFGRTALGEASSAYLYYPVEEFGFDIAKEHPAIAAWLERMKALPGWAHPYDIMPGYPLGTDGYRNRKVS